MSWEEAWRLSPPEWWTLYSMLFGQRKKRADSGLNGDDVKGMRERLNEAVRKEKEARERRT